MTQLGHRQHFHFAPHQQRFFSESEASEVLARAVDLEPNLSVRILDEKLPGMHESVLANMLESYRRASLRE